MPGSVIKWVTSPLASMPFLKIVPCHSPNCSYENWAWYNEPPSSIVAVIDGAVNASLSAIICLILAVKAVFKSSGVSATIALSHSSWSIHSWAVAEEVKVLEPILASSWNLRKLSPVIPPP